MAASQKFCLKWNNFQSSVTSVFDTLRQDEELVDITLCCEGKKIKAHRMMLSACSPYFRELFKDNPCQHPLFFLKDTSYADIAAVIEFVYKGEVNVVQSQLASFLKTAELLQVKGLSGDEEEDQAPRAPPSPAVRERPPDRSRLGPPGPPPPPSTIRQRPRESAETPASPRFKRRRLSGSSVGQPASPASVSAAPPPAAASSVSRDSVGDVIPPSATGMPPPPVSGELSAPATPQHDPPPPPPPPPAAEHDYHVIKVEKIDIADDDDDVSLEATLGQVSTFEASHYDGSDHSASSHDMSGLLSGMAEQVGEHSASGDDGSAQGGLQIRYSCAICYKSFKREASLRHHRAVHEGGLTGAAGGFRCPMCPKTFMRRGSLSQHQAVHEGRTTCPVCGKVCSSVSNMSIHRRLHRRLTTCPVCGLVCSSVSTMSIHRRLHCRLKNH